MLTILRLYVALGLLYAVLGVPLAGRRIPPNGWYGFRVPKTMKPGNEHIWYEVNAYSGCLMVWAGAISVMGTVALWFVKGQSVDTYALRCMGVTMAALIITLALSFRYLATLK